MHEYMNARANDRASDCSIDKPNDYSLKQNNNKFDGLLYFILDSLLSLLDCLWYTVGVVLVLFFDYINSLVFFLSLLLCSNDMS